MDVLDPTYNGIESFVWYATQFGRTYQAEVEILKNGIVVSSKTSDYVDYGASDYYGGNNFGGGSGMKMMMGINAPKDDQDELEADDYNIPANGSFDRPPVNVSIFGENGGGGITFSSGNGEQTTSGSTNTAPANAPAPQETSPQEDVDDTAQADPKAEAEGDDEMFEVTGHFGEEYNVSVDENAPEAEADDAEADETSESDGTVADETSEAAEESSETGDVIDDLFDETAADTASEGQGLPPLMPADTSADDLAQALANASQPLF